MAPVRLTLLLPLLLIGGCYLDGLTGLNQGLDFSWEPDGFGEWLEEPEVEVAAAAGGTVVTARLSAPDPCQRLSGESARSGSRVTLRVTIAREGDACVAAIGTFTYRAEIGGLMPGTYEVRVVHDYPGTGWPSGTVLETAINVP